MKKILVVALALVLSLALAAPVMADVPAEGSITAGTGDPPIIKCKWETPDTGDPTHETLGTQILPPLVWGTYTTVGYYAVVTDPQGWANIAAVYADVYHPLESPLNGSFKYQVELTRITNETTGINKFNQAVDQGLITARSINPLTGYEYLDEEIIHELEQGLAWVYRIEYSDGLWYEQPAGDYKVIIVAVNTYNQEATLQNYFEYVPVHGCEIDFTSFIYGPVSPYIHKQIGGDTDFADPKAPAGHGVPNGATIRNIGNTLCKVTVYQTDLSYETSPGSGVWVELGKTGDAWNVEYDARLGVDGQWVYYDPEEEDVVLPDILDLSEVEKLDFSILIKKYGITGAFQSAITIGCMYEPFGD